MKIKTTTDLMATLYPFQKKGVEFHLSHHYSINGCKMGLGKTIQAIATLAHVKGPACIVCPAYLRKNWLSEIDKFLPESYSFNILVLSYERFLKDAPKTCEIIIFDEAHYLKNMQSKRTKFTHDYVNSVKPHYLLMLSGTPIKNRVTEFYSLMKLCSYNPKKTSGIPLVKGFTVFANALSHVTAINTGYGTVMKYHGLKNRRLLLKYLKDKYFSATNDKPLPELYRQNIIIGAIKNKTLIEELEKDFYNNHISTAKKNIAIEKAKFTGRYVKDCLNSGESPLLVFSDHIEPCHAIQTFLNSEGINRVCVITGATPSDERHRLVVAFQQKLIDVLICTIGSMSTGFTLTATNRVVFNDLSWCPADNEQAEKRIHRIGQQKDCYMVRLLSEGIDKKIIETLQEKQNTINKVYSN